jgi:hypothetical protein
MKIEIDEDIIKENDRNMSSSHSSDISGSNKHEEISPITAEAPKKFKIKFHHIKGKSLNFDLNSDPNTERSNIQEESQRSSHNSTVNQTQSYSGIDSIEMDLTKSELRPSTNSCNKVGNKISTFE